MLMYGAGAAWSRLFLPGAGANPIWSEPESAPGSRTSGAGAILAIVPTYDNHAYL